jgi:hypothetical protein
VTIARRDPPRRVTPEVLAFYKKKAQRLRLAARLRARRRLCRWLAKMQRRLATIR